MATQCGEFFRTYDLQEQALPKQGSSTIAPLIVCSHGAAGFILTLQDQRSRSTVKINVKINSQDQQSRSTVISGLKDSNRANNSATLVRQSDGL